jgi:hypothetical protein
MKRQELKLTKNTKKKRGRKPNPETIKFQEVSNWDPISQAKFIFQINKEIGKPISMAEAYQTACESVLATNLPES